MEKEIQGTLVMNKIEFYNVGMPITSLHNNMFKIESQGKLIFLDGTPAIKKNLPKSSHCRDIYLTKLHVIKVALVAEIDQNFREFSLWKEVKKNVDDMVFFAPTLFCSRNGRYLVQARIKFSAHKQTEEAEQIIASLCKKYDMRDVEDRYGDNWKMIAKNHPVIIDYGSEGY